MTALMEECATSGAAAVIALKGGQESSATRVNFDQTHTQSLFVNINPDFVSFSSQM